MELGFWEREETKRDPSLEGSNRECRKFFVRGLKKLESWPCVKTGSNGMEGPLSLLPLPLLRLYRHRRQNRLLLPLLRPLHLRIRLQNRLHQEILAYELPLPE
jgi:hypothetical protein